MESTSILKRIFLVFGIALLIIIILIFMYKSSFNKLNENTRLLIHNMEVLDNTEQLIRIVSDMESGTRGYALTEDPRFLIPYEVAKSTYINQINDLRKLVKNNKTQSAYLDTLTGLIDRKVRGQEFIIHLKETDNLKFGYQRLLVESSLRMDSIKSVASRMKTEENKMRIFRSLEGSDSIMNTKILSTIFSFTAVLVMLISLFYILVEIRSKRKVKDFLDAVLQSSQSAILSFNAIHQPDGRISDFICVHANRLGKSIAANPDINLVGRTMIDIFPDVATSGLLEEYIKVVKDGIFYKTERYYPGEKKGRWFRIVAVKLDDGITVTYDDISKEKEYEVALQKYIIELKRSNNELEQFAFVASHDLQEPLRKIQAFGDRLNVKAGHLLTDETKIYMDKMLSASSRMSRLITDLLNFSRLVKSRDDFVKTDINKIIQDVISDLELTITKKQAVIAYERLPTIEAIPSQMYQLFFNLLGNALKFTRENATPQIFIKSEIINYEEGGKEFTDNKENQKLRIVFSDNGIGFDPKYVDKIFVIFQRLHGKHAYEGTGIGLAICKRIITNHDGSITAAGRPGEGAVFTIELPVLQHR